MLNKANTIANKPAGQDDWLHIPICLRKAQTVAKSTESQRHVRGLAKSVETLAKKVLKSRHNPIEHP
jgi:hypothetical protein